VVAKTFAWSSLRILHKIPRGDAAILVLVSGMTVLTNLAAAVAVGVAAAALQFAWQTGSRLDVRRREEGDGVVYEIHGPLFFGSVRNFSECLRPADDPKETAADFQFCEMYDHSALEAVRALAGRYRGLGKTLHLRGLSPRSRRLLHRAGGLGGVSVCEDAAVQSGGEPLAGGKQ